MNVIWRTLLVLWSSRRRLRRDGPMDATAVGRLRLRTLPTDLDILRHMNNGRYLSLFDLGRWDLLVRTGLLDAMRERDWYPVVASQTITFRKSLLPWQRFVVETRFLGHDDRSLYLEHRAVVRGEIYARAIIRARMLRRGGGLVTHEEFFAAVGHHSLPDVEPWVHDWAEASALPSTKAEAPSTWA